MSSIFSYIGVFFVYLAAYLPFGVLYALSDGMYFLIYHVFGYRKKVVRQNINNSLGHLSIEERKLVERKFYKHLCDMIFETAKLLNLSDTEIKNRIRLKNSEEYHRLVKEGKNITIVFGHYLNWEWVVLASAYYTPMQVYGIYKKLTNKVFDKLFFRMRERENLVPLEMQESTKFMLKNAVKPSALIILTDQTPSNWEQSYWKKFLNQDTPIFSGTEKISQKLNSSLVFLKAKRIKRGIMELEFVVLAEETKDMKEHSITDLHTEFLEKQILEEPAYWLWSHRRWKHKATDSIKQKYNLQ